MHVVEARHALPLRTTYIQIPADLKPLIYEQRYWCGIAVQLI